MLEQCVLPPLHLVLELLAALLADEGHLVVVGADVHAEAVLHGEGLPAAGAVAGEGPLASVLAGVLLEVVAVERGQRDEVIGNPTSGRRGQLAQK